MSANVDQTKRQLGPAWRKDGGSFGTPNSSGNKSQNANSAQPATTTTRVTGATGAWANGSSSQHIASAAARAARAAPAVPPTRTAATSNAHQRSQNAADKGPSLSSSSNNSKLRTASFSSAHSGDNNRSASGDVRTHRGGGDRDRDHHHHHYGGGGQANTAAPMNIALRTPEATFSRAELLALRRPTEMLESIRASVPRELVSHDALDPISSKPRLTSEEIAAAWEAGRPRPLEREDGTLVPAAGSVTGGLGDASSDKQRRYDSLMKPSSLRAASANSTGTPSLSEREQQRASERGRWERGLSVPVGGGGNSHGNNSKAIVWDEIDPDSDTYGDDGTALTSWAEAAQAFEREMKAMREASAKGLPVELPNGDVIGSPDMFGAAMSIKPEGGTNKGEELDDEDEAPSNVDRSDATERLEALEAAAALQSQRLLDDAFQLQQQKQRELQQQLELQQQQELLQQQQREQQELLHQQQREQQLREQQLRQQQQQQQQQELRDQQRREEEQRRRDEESRRREEERRLEEERQRIILLPWYYRDPHGKIQGPFEAAQMLQWFEAGYFRDDLPLCQGDTQGQFVALGELFPVASEAFVSLSKVQLQAQQQRQQKQAEQSAVSSNRLVPEPVAVPSPAAAPTLAAPLASLTSLLGEPQQTQQPQQPNPIGGSPNFWGMWPGGVDPTISGAQPNAADQPVNTGETILGGWRGRPGSAGPGTLEVGGLGALGGALYEPPVPAAEPPSQRQQQSSRTMDRLGSNGGADLALDGGRGGMPIMLGVGGSGVVFDEPGDLSRQQQQRHHEAVINSQVHQQQQKKGGKQANQQQQQRQRQQGAELSTSSTNPQSRRAQRRQEAAAAAAAAQQPPAVSNENSPNAVNVGPQRSDAPQPIKVAVPSTRQPPRAPWAQQQQQGSSVEVQQQARLAQTQQVSNKLSLREIQQQEESARAAAVAERQRQIAAQHQQQANQRSTNPQHASMAARLAATHGINTSGPPNPNRSGAVSVQGSSGVAMGQAQQQPQQQRRPAVPQNDASSKRAAAAIPPAPLAQTTAANANTFEVWCKTQLKKITGSDDLTLIQFCMTLDDTSEIRQYLSLYLGSTPQVATFANEFIKKKQANKAAANSPALKLQTQGPPPSSSSSSAGYSKPQNENDDSDMITVNSKTRRGRGRRAKAAAAS